MNENTGWWFFLGMVVGAAIGAGWAFTFVLYLKW